MHRAVTKVPVIEKSYAILMGQTTIPAGKVEFDLKNIANMPHEFVVFRTGFAPDQLPVSNGQVNEKAQGLKKIGEQDQYPAGQTRTLTVNLKPGYYVAICNIPGHYQQGMHIGFQVVK